MPRKLKWPMRVIARVGESNFTTLEDYSLIYVCSISEALRKAISRLDRHLDRVGKVRPSQQARSSFVDDDVRA